MVPHQVLMPAAVNRALPAESKISLSCPIPSVGHRHFGQPPKIDSATVRIFRLDRYATLFKNDVWAVPPIALELPAERPSAYDRRKGCYGIGIPVPHPMSIGVPRTLAWQGADATDLPRDPGGGGLAASQYLVSDRSKACQAAEKY